MNWDKSQDIFSDLQNMVDKIRNQTKIKRPVTKCEEISHFDKLDFEAFCCLVFTTDMIVTKKTHEKMKEYGMLEDEYEFSKEAKERASKFLNSLLTF